MKSAPSGDLTWLAGGPATSPSGRQRRGYTTGRSGHRSLQLSDRAFPRDRGFAPESAPGGSVRLSQIRCAALRRGEGAPQPPSPEDQLRLGIFLLPTLQASSSGLGPAPRCPQLLGAVGARVAADSCASGSRPAGSRADLAGSSRDLLSLECRRPDGEPGSPRGWAEFGRRASPRAAGRRGACLREARPAACPRSPGSSPWAGAVFGENRSSLWPGALSFCPGATTGVGGGRGAHLVRVGARAGCREAIGSPAFLGSSAGYLRQSEVADTQETPLTAQSLCLTPWSRPKETEVSGAFKKHARCSHVSGSLQSPAGNALALQRSAL